MNPTETSDAENDAQAAPARVVTLTIPERVPSVWNEDARRAAVVLERSDGHVVAFDPWFVKHVHGVRTGTILDERPDLGAVVECRDGSIHLVVGAHRDVAEQVIRARAGL